MTNHKDVTVNDGSRIRLLAAVQDEYQVFIRLSPTLVMGHAVLLGAHYLHLYKANGEAYYFHGSVYFVEREDGAVLWNVNLACDVTEERQKEAKDIAWRSVESARQVKGAGIFMQLLSIAALPMPHETNDGHATKKRRPTLAPTR